MMIKTHHQTLKNSLSTLGQIHWIRHRSQSNKLLIKQIATAGLTIVCLLSFKKTTKINMITPTIRASLENRAASVLNHLKNTFKAYPFTIFLGDKQYKNCIFSHEYKFNGAGKAGKERIALTQLPCDDNTNESSKSKMFVGFDYLPKGIHTNAAKKAFKDKWQQKNNGG